MSSLVRRIQKGRGNFIGMLTSSRKAWGAKLGVKNAEAKDLLARADRENRKGK